MPDFRIIVRTHSPDVLCHPCYGNHPDGEQCYALCDSENDCSCQCDSGVPNLEGMTPTDVDSYRKAEAA